MTATTVSGAAAPRGGVLDHVSLHHVVTLDELDQCRRWLGEQHDGPVCFDTESAGLRPEHDLHRMIQIGDKWSGWAFPPSWFGAALELLSGYTGTLGAWNVPYDTRVLGVNQRLWLNWSQLLDGMLIGHLVDSSAPLGLKPRAARDIDPTAMVWERQLNEAKRKQHWDYATTPDDFPLYWQYGAADTVLASHLIDKHLPTVRQRWPYSLDIEMAYARLCAGMMTAGMMIDRPYINERIAEVSAYYEQAMGWLAQFGITSVDANADVGAALETVGVPIGPRTDTGQPKVDKATMLEYQARYPHAAAMIGTIRGAKKARTLLSNVLTKFARMAGSDDVIHYAIHSIGAAATGRSSVSDPSMQNLDREIEMVRGCYIPREGYSFICIDADQIEMREAAHFSGDRQLLADFAECDATGASFFLDRVAPRIYGPITKKDPRYSTTKNTAYGILFGAGPYTAAVTAGVPLSQIEPIYRAWKRMYPTLDKWSRDLVNGCKYMRSAPYVETLSGRHLRVRRGKEYAGVDYKIQGSAAELMKTGGIRLDAAGLGEYLRLSVHDEWLLEVPKHLASEILRAATEILTDRTSLALPITWEGQILDHRWVKT